MHPAPGVLLGKYRLTRKLGEGGMGQVWQAEDTGRVHREVAIKVILMDHAEAQELARLLLDEARAMTGIPFHPNMVALLDVLELGDTAALVMEYVPGPILSAWIAAHPGGLPWGAVYPVAKALTEALTHAHRHGVVHRDLKPENIKTRTGPGGLLKPEDVKILDFGLARRDAGRTTTEGEIGGTLPYMSPEQCLGQVQGPPSDQYNLGVILMELITGFPPFVGVEPPSLVGYTAAHCLRTPPPLRTRRADVPEAVDRLILRCLAKEPAERHASVEALAALLLPELAHLAQWTGSAGFDADAADVMVPGFSGPIQRAEAPADAMEATRQSTQATQPVHRGSLPQTQRPSQAPLVDQLEGLALALLQPGTGPFLGALGRATGREGFRIMGPADFLPRDLADPVTLPLERKGRLLGRLVYPGPPLVASTALLARAARLLAEKLALEAGPRDGREGS